MSLHAHWGHSDLLATLARARQRDSLPAALLIHGPKGVGKQHLALWLGRLLLCRDPGPEGPCEACSSCRLALKLEHPDLHWFFPLSRPKNASTPEKLARALEEARWEALAEIRRDPLRPLISDGPRSLYLAAAQTLRRQAQHRPSMGDRQVFLVAEAEALAPQESSSEAANALLKLLEEPPTGTTLILTSGEPGRLLPTIRSRTTQLHLPPLKKEEVVAFLTGVMGVEGKEAKRVGALSQGSIGRAVRLLPDAEGPGPLEQVRLQAFGLLRAALAPSPTEALTEALTFKTTGARGLMELMDFLAEWLRDLALAASGEYDRAMNPDGEGFFREVLARWDISPFRVSTGLRRLDEARLLASGNANPQLLVFGLLHDLRKALLEGQAPSSPER